MPPQFCPHGHDTLLVGRDGNGWCRQCGRNAANSEHGRALARERRKKYRKTDKGRLNHLANQKKYANTHAGKLTIERKNTTAWKKRLKNAISNKEALIEELEALLND